MVPLARRLLSAGGVELASPFGVVKRIAKTAVRMGENPNEKITDRGRARGRGSNAGCDGSRTQQSADDGSAGLGCGGRCVVVADETPRRKIIITTDLPSAISGKRLLGTSIENAAGEGKVGSISDLVFGSDARLAAVIVAEGGFLGIGADHVQLKPQLITIKRQPDGSFKARTNVSEAQMDRAGDAAFVSSIEAIGPNYKNPANRRLAALIGASVVGPNGEKVASVEDILLSPTGDASYAILSLGPASAPRVVVQFSSLKFTRSDEPLHTTRTAADLQRLAEVQ